VDEIKQRLDENCRPMSKSQQTDDAGIEQWLNPSIVSHKWNQIGAADEAVLNAVP
jgi:hypothetical protein